MEERRQAARQRTLKGARIVFNDGFSTIDCQVRNLSTIGALLRVASAIGIPDRFTLRFDDGRSFSCVVARRAVDAVGVSFIDH